MKKKLHLDYPLTNILYNKLGEENFIIFLNKFKLIVTADDETENFLKILFKKHNIK